MEKLVIDQAAVTWLGVHSSEMQAASPEGASLAQAAFCLKRAESAQRRQLTSLKTLATLRALLPAGLSPLNSIRLYEPREKQA